MCTINLSVNLIQLGIFSDYLTMDGEKEMIQNTKEEYNLERNEYVRLRREEKYI